MTDIVNILRQGRVVTATLNRPEALNALNRQTMLELTSRLAAFDTDDGVGCFVITGAGKAFAAGADIREMQSLDYHTMLTEDYFAPWQALADLRTPKIAAVNGFALGGGCELAMMCDIILAADTATFGQPEIKLGVMPGMGGTQRLVRLVGRTRAMELILTGRNFSALEAERMGLVAAVVPLAELAGKAAAMAATIAGHSKPATLFAREAVNRADEVGMREGILFERRVFHSLFALQDQREGMTAFIEKRAPEFKHK